MHEERPAELTAHVLDVRPSERAGEGAPRAVVQRLDDTQERSYAITIERKVKHPAAVALTRTAKAELFASPTR